MAGWVLVARAVGVKRIVKLLAWVLVMVIVTVCAAFGLVAAVLGTIAAAFGMSDQQAVGVSECDFAGEQSVTSLPGKNGEGTFSVSAAQWKVASSLYVGAKQVAATDVEIVFVLAAALQESSLQVYANEIVADSLNYPHDAVATPKTDQGESVDAIGALQQRPSAGWGEVSELMDPVYEATAFLGGETGPNKGSPAGLRDIDGWEMLSFGDAVERVQVSGHPELYAQWETTAHKLLAALQDSGEITCTATVTGTARYPFADFRVWHISDGVGWRNLGGRSDYHPALDFTKSFACGKQILAIRPGTVVAMNNYSDGSNPVWIQSDDGVKVGYLHMKLSDQEVKVGQTVTAGGLVGRVGEEGNGVTGCHLDLRVDASEATSPAVRAIPFLPDPDTPNTFIDPAAYLALFGLDLLSVEK